MIIATLSEVKGSKSLLSAYKSSIFLVRTSQGISLCCNAQRDDLVERIRYLKVDFSAKYAVIPPGRCWIESNCEEEKDLDKYLDLYDDACGALSKVCFTLILRLGNNKTVSHLVGLGHDTIGVKISDDPFFELVNVMGIPILSTTPARINAYGVDSVDDIHPEIVKSCSFFIESESRLKSKEAKIIRW